MNAIRIICPAGHQEVRVEDESGKLRGVIHLSDPTSERDWEAELRQARAAKAACEMLGWVVGGMAEQERKPDNCVKPGKRAAAYAAGLEMGLRGEYRVIGVDPDHNIRGSVTYPEHKLAGPSLARGWDLGRAINAALAISRGEPDPRRGG